MNESYTRGVGAAELWAGILLGPMALLSQLQANYALALWACGAGRTWPLHLVTLSALAITSLGAFLSYRNWHRLGARWDAEGAGVVVRGRFMAALGILISLLMLLVIVAMWIPVFMYGPCQRSA